MDSLEPSLIAGFLAAAALLVMSPGPDTMLIIRNSLAGGTPAGLASVAGVQVGLVGHTALAVGGLSLLIVSSPVLFKGVAVAGALYLAYLAVDALRTPVMPLGAAKSQRRITMTKAARDALFTNLLNPKVVLLFIALMPQFVDTAAGRVWLQLITLGLGLLIINVAWQLPLALAATAMRRWLGAPGIQRTINWVTFFVFMGFAILMLYEHLIGGSW